MASLMYCTLCGNRGRAIRRMRGSPLFELLLYVPPVFLFVFPILFVPGALHLLAALVFWVPAAVMGIPAMVYSIWRHTTVARVCQYCGSTFVVPAESPRARALQGY